LNHEQELIWKLSLTDFQVKAVEVIITFLFRGKILWKELNLRVMEEADESKVPITHILTASYLTEPFTLCENENQYQKTLKIFSQDFLQKDYLLKIRGDPELSWGIVSASFMVTGCPENSQFNQGVNVHTCMCNSGFFRNQTESTFKCSPCPYLCDVCDSKKCINCKFNLVANSEGQCELPESI
jgi:hypothetical protein